MNMPRNSQASLGKALSASGEEGVLFGKEAGLSWNDLRRGTVLRRPRTVISCGRSILVATTSQPYAAATLVELDGVARRVILYPPDLSLDHLGFVADCAGVDVIVSDRLSNALRHDCMCAALQLDEVDPAIEVAVYTETEWVLLHVPGTTVGLPGGPRPGKSDRCDWNRTLKRGGLGVPFYDIRRYGGLQIFLRAALTGTSLVLSSAHESTADFLLRAASHKVTHISGTPSHWRRALMSSAAHLITPEYVRLSGEIADQTVLNQLRAVYPQARIGHAFATTEAGVAF